MSEQVIAPQSLRTLEQRIARLEAKNAIENLMGRYEFLHSANMHDDCLKLFAMQSESTRVEMMWGVYDGPEGVRRCYSGFHIWIDGDPTGRMHIHTLTTQVIEVAEDGQTARGVWISPGCETSPDINDPMSEEMKARWAWCKYGCDFILENGIWKIWHLHVYGLFMSPCDASWVESGEVLDGSQMPPIPIEYAPDRPPTTSWVYRPDALYVNEPAPPAPYSTFDDVIDPF